MARARIDYICSCIGRLYLFFSFCQLASCTSHLFLHSRYLVQEVVNFCLLAFVSLFVLFVQSIGVSTRRLWLSHRIPLTLLQLLLLLWLILLLILRLILLWLIRRKHVWIIEACLHAISRRIVILWSLIIIWILLILRGPSRECLSSKQERRK